MSQDDKPFVCTASGCGMQFTNEDHLTVHRKKHEMSLALNTGGTGTKSSNNLYLDQTPTPTKFLKNCEEIGLFQELTKNPFDEAFKKSTEAAVESSPLPGPNTAELNTPVPFISKLIENIVKEKPSSSDSLPVVEDGVLDLSSSRKAVLNGTPPCQPQPTSTTTEEEEEEMVAVDLHPVSSSPALLTSPAVKSNVVTTTASSTIVVPVVQPQVATQPVQPNLMQVYLQLPTGQTLPIQVHASQVQTPQLQLVTPSVQIQKTNCVVQGVQSVQSVVMDGSNRISSTTSPDQTTFTKQKLKAAIQNSQSAADQKVGMSPDLPGRTIPHVVSPMSNTSASVDGYSDGYDSDETSSSIRRGIKRTLDDESDDRRKKFLERNRAAAARCRHKRKQWISSLEKKAEDLQNNNNKLQTEVNGLRNEVSQLKTLLLAHKDCPVTIQQQKSQLQLTVQNVAESSNVILGSTAGSDQRLLTADGTAISVVPTLPTSDTNQIASNNPTPNNISLLSSLQHGLIIPSVIASSSDPGGKIDSSPKLS